MKKALTVFVTILVCFACFNPVPVSAAEATGTAELDTLSLIADKRIGVTVGSSYEGYIKKNLPDAEPMSFYNLSVISAALKSGKIDAVLDSYHILSYIRNHDEGLVLLDAPFLTVNTGHAFRKGDGALRDEFNEFLAQIKADGTFDDIYNRYVLKKDYTMPYIPSSGKNGDYVFGTRISYGFPFVSINEEGEFIGLDVEIAKRFAACTDRRLIIRNTNFAGLTNALTAGKVDAIGGHFTQSDEGRQTFEFSDIVYTDPAGVLTTRQNMLKWTGAAVGAVSESRGFWDDLKYRVYTTIVAQNRYKLILSGLSATAVISLWSALFGTALAALLCYMRLSKSKTLKTFAGTYVVIMRGTPVLVLLLIIFFIVFHSVDVSPSIVAVIAFSMHFAAHVSEIFRISIKSVDNTQWEAGLAGGFTPKQTFGHIVLPQAMGKILPLFKARFVSLVQETSIAGSIAAFDLTEAANFIQSSTYDAFVPYILVLVLYFIISWTLILFLSGIERLAAERRRKRV